VKEYLQRRAEYQDKKQTIASDSNRARILRRRRHPSSIAPAYCNRGMNHSVAVPTNSSISSDDGNVAADSGTEFASRMPPVHLTVRKLPLQNVHDMPFVFPSPAA
jgi:hypothetical protein